MSGSFVGVVNLGQAVPLAVTADATISAVKAPAIAELQARLAGVVQATAAMTATPPTAAANLQAAAGIVAALEASIAIGVPSVDFQIAALAAARLEIEAALAALDVSLGININTPGVYLYRYSGRNDLIASGFYNVLGSGLPGASPSQHAEAWLLAAVAPSAQATLSVVLGG